MKQPDYLTLHKDLQEYLPLLQTVGKELRYGDPSHPRASDMDALVIRFGFFFGWKYQVRSINRLGQEGGGAYFDPTPDGMRALEAYIIALLKTHHKPIDNPAIQKMLAEREAKGGTPTLRFYMTLRDTPLDRDEETKAHEQRLSQLTVEEVQPGELL